MMRPQYIIACFFIEREMTRRAGGVGARRASAHHARRIAADDARRIAPATRLDADRIRSHPTPFSL